MQVELYIPKNGTTLYSICRTVQYDTTFWLLTKGHLSGGSKTLPFGCSLQASR